MKEETGRWVDRAKDHLRKACDNFQLENHDLASFLCHQVVELALKAFLIETTGRFPRSHDLVQLGRLVGIDADLLQGCKSLTPVYTEARYPDVGAGGYTAEETEQSIVFAERVLKWILERIS